MHNRDMSHDAVGSLRSLSVLICDMVGSTDVRVRLGPDGERLFPLLEEQYFIGALFDRAEGIRLRSRY